MDSNNHRPSDGKAPLEADDIEAGVDYSAAETPNAPPEFMERWQSIADILALVFGAEVALIMMVRKDSVEVVARSVGEDNPYHVGDRQQLARDVYCQAVLETGDIYYIDDARKYERWQSSPAIKLNLISYIGAPIRWPEGGYFGTICVMSSKTISDEEILRSVLTSFRNLMEDQLKLLHMIDSQVSVERLLQERAMQLETARSEAILLMKETETQKQKAETLLIEVQEYRDHLERLVDERTADVIAAQQRSVRYFDFMAHDIANLLTPALIYAEMLLDDDMSERNKSRVGKVIDQLKRASTFVLNVRWLDEVATADEFNYVVVDVRSMIDELTDLMSKEFSRPVDISLECDAHSVEIYAFEYVKSLLHGVLRNAVLHSKHKDALVHVELSIMGDLCRIVVSDHGGGISDPIKDILNTPLDLSKRYSRGVASELSIYKAILVQLGGDLVVGDRVPGEYAQGARIEMTIPCRHSDAQCDSKRGGLR